MHKHVYTDRRTDRHAKSSFTLSSAFSHMLFSHMFLDCGSYFSQICYIWCEVCDIDWFMYINITGKKLHLFQFIGKKNVVIDMHVVLSLYFVKIIFLHIKMNDMYICVCVLFHTTVMFLKSCGGFERRDAKQGYWFSKSYENWPSYI